MRFMMLMLPGEKAEAGILPDASVFAAMMKYNEELQKAASCARWMGSTRAGRACASRPAEESPA